MNLSTGKVITKNRVTMVSLLSTVKQRVEEIVSEQGLESTKFTIKSGVEFPNIKARRSTKYTDVYDDYNNYNKDYMDPQ